MTTLSNYFNQTIKPLNDELGRMLDDCDHADSTIELIEYSMPSFSEDSGRYADDDSRYIPTLVCKCGYEEIAESEE